MRVRYGGIGLLLLLLLLLPVVAAMAQTTLIRDIQNNPSAYTTATIEGVVTIGAGLMDSVKLKAYVQDSTGYGIQIFNYTMSADDRTTFVRGNLVRVTGTVQNYVSTHAVTTEISAPTSTLLGTGTMPTPPLITVAQSLDTLHYEGAFFEVQGTIGSIYDAGFALLIDLTDAASQTLTIKVPLSAHIPTGTLQTGNSYRISGVGETYDATIELDLGYVEDVVAAADTDTTTHGTITSIRAIQTNPTAYSNVTIEGIVTIGANLLDSTRLKAYVQDTSGYGIQVFGFSITSTDLSNYIRGNRVRVAGTVSNYQGTHGATTELSGATCTLLGVGTLPTAPTITVAQLLADTLHWEGGYFEVEGTIGSTYDAGFARLVDFTDAASQMITVKIPSTAHLAANVVVQGSRYRIRGVGESYDGMELDLAYAADVALVDSSDTSTGPTTTSIRDIQVNPAAFGSVTIEGIVTIGANLLDSVRMKAYVQDESGYGIQIFGFAITSTDRTNYVRGNHVRVTGTVSNYMGTHGATTELSSATTTLLGTGTMPTAPILSVAAVLADTLHWEGAFFEVPGTVTAISDQGWALLIDMQDAAARVITLKVPSTAHLPAGTFVLNQKYRVRGIGEAYDGIELDVAYAEDVLPDTGRIVVNAGGELKVIVDSTTFIPIIGESFNSTMIIAGTWRFLMQVYDMGGNIRRTLYDQVAVDSLTIPWDGRDQNGDLLPPGAYVIYLEASNPSNGEVRHARRPAVLAYRLKKQ